MSAAVRARLAVLASSLLASTGGAAIKAADLPIADVAGLRAALASLVLLALLRPGPGSWTGRALLVGCVQAAMMALFVAGNKLTTAASAIYLQSTAPLYVLLLSPIALGERIRRTDLGYLAAFALGLALFLVRTDDRQATAPEPFLGNLVAAAGGLGWALTILGLRWLATDRRATGDGGATGDHRATAGRGGSGSRPGSGEPAAAATVLANAVVAAACLPWLGAAPSRIAVADWTAILWLGVFQVGLAYVLLTRAVRHLPAFEVAMLTLVEPVLSPLWAWLLHGERPGAWALAGGGLILATGALRTWSGARRA